MVEKIPKNITDTHACQDNLLTWLTKEELIVGSNPTLPKSMAYVVSEKAEYRLSIFFPAMVYKAPMMAANSTASAPNI